MGAFALPTGGIDVAAFARLVADDRAIKITAAECLPRQP